MLVKLVFYSAILLLAFLGYRNYAFATSLKMGNEAPGFTLKDAQGQTHRLSDYSGKYLVLYFYPKDDTPVCTKEACSFRDNLQAFEKLNAKIVGISVDSVASHANFAKKNSLSFPLLSDPDGKVAASYHALTDFYIVKIAKRYTYLISPDGKIAKIYTNVDAAKHSKQIIDDLTTLQNKP